MKLLAHYKNYEIHSDDLENGTYVFYMRCDRAGITQTPQQVAFIAKGENIPSATIEAVENAKKMIDSIR